MIEPRRSFHMLQKPQPPAGGDSETYQRHSLYNLLAPGLFDSEQDDDSNDEPPYRVFKHDEPEIPVHPALEYEVVEASLASWRRSRRRSSRRMTITRRSRSGTASFVVGPVEDSDCASYSSTTTTTSGGADEETTPLPPASQSASSHEETTRNTNNNNNNNNSGSASSLVCGSSMDGKVLLSFLGLIIFGTLNAVSLKLQAIPMFNYPNFLNLFCNMMYIPICFAYIIPTACCCCCGEGKKGDSDDERDEGNSVVLVTSRGNVQEDCSLQLQSSSDSNNEETTTQSTSEREAPGARASDVLLQEETRFLHGATNTSQSSSTNTPSSSDSAPPGLQDPELRQPLPPKPSESLRLRDLSIMGFLDSLATTMQIYAAVYLPGPLLILLPQAAVPLSLFVSLLIKTIQSRQQRRASSWRFHWTQYVGGIVVALGILVLMTPHWTNLLSPSHYCEAIDVENDCTICQLETDKESCLSHSASSKQEDGDDTGSDGNRTDLAISSFERGLQQIYRKTTMTYLDTTTTTTPNDDNLCQWRPFDEADRKEEILASIWSGVLIASCLPMILSTLYKEWAMERKEASLSLSSLSSSRNDYPIYLNGWIAVFQLFFSIPLAFLGGLVSSPALVQPRQVLENLWYGLQCYLLGSASITTGCHPDALCGTFSFWLVNLHLFASLGYSYFMLFCLKYGSTSLFFLAVTLMVPLGTAFFLLPIMPLAGTPYLTDFAGSIAIVLGLVLYRFFGARRGRGSDDNDDELRMGRNVPDDEDDPYSYICRASFPWQQRRSTTPDEEDSESSSSLSDTHARTPLLSGDV